MYNNNAHTKKALHYADISTGAVPGAEFFFTTVISAPSEKTHIDRSAQPALQQTTTREHTATTEHVVDN